MRCYTHIPLKFLLHSFPLLSEFVVPSTELIQCEQCAEDFVQKRKEIHFILSQANYPIAEDVPFNNEHNN